MKARWPVMALCLPVALAAAQDVTVRPTEGGSACVVAKKLGNSLAIEWAVGEISVSLAIEAAKSELLERGFEYVFPQASSDIPHGWLVAIRTRYETYAGKIRVSYGCGLSAISQNEAEQYAVRDLQSYSWGWNPNNGYKIIEIKQF